MAKVRRDTAKKEGKKKLALKRSGPIKVSLPTKPTKQSNNFRDYSMLIHGEKKIGKTTLLAQEEGAFFIEWDPEQKSLAILQEQCPDWAHFKAYVVALENAADKGKLPYKTVVVDGADIMYRSCFDWSCKKMVINHPHEENDFGQSWDFIRNEFHDVVLRIMRIKGLASRFICHSAWKEQKSRGGGGFDKLVPTLKSQPEEILIGLIDIWAAYVYDGKKRTLVIKGDESTGAGHRVDHRFRTTKGEMIEEVPMGRSPQDAYKNLMEAWDCKQTFATIEERDEKRRKKKKKKKTGKKKKKGQ